jgi:hypothetical protein
MAFYIANPRTGNIPVVVATGTAVKTVLQVAVPATATIDRLIAWGISFDSSVSGQPGICTLMDTDVAATVTTLTANPYNHTDELASACVGGTALTGYNASAEGTIGATTRELDAQLVHPQVGYSLWWPEGRWQPKIKQSRFLRIRTTFPVTVNCLPWVIWAE